MGSRYSIGYWQSPCQTVPKRQTSPKQGFTRKWCGQINQELSTKVVPGHEKIKGKINIDPSQTPSGKLCRIPLGSLHMKDPKTIDGISIPITEKMLEKDNLIDKLREFKPEDLVKSLDKLAGRLPKKL